MGCYRNKWLYDVHSEDFPLKKTITYLNDVRTRSWCVRMNMSTCPMLGKNVGN